MTRPRSNAETRSYLVEQVSFLLKTYHLECHKGAASRETEFWRGSISGFRYAVGEIYGHDVIHRVLEDMRKNTGLEVPPIGELSSEGKFLGRGLGSRFLIINLSRGWPSLRYGNVAKR
jgi:hypothetical protein